MAPAKWKAIETEHAAPSTGALNVDNTPLSPEIGALRRQRHPQLSFDKDGQVVRGRFASAAAASLNRTSPPLIGHALPEIWRESATVQRPGETISPLAGPRSHVHAP